MDTFRRNLNRKTFMGLFIAGVGAVGSAAVGIPIVGYIIGPLINPPANVWRDVGAVDDFPLGSTTQVNIKYPGTLSWGGSTDFSAAWLRRHGNHDFIAFSDYCPHLGCGVHWQQAPQIFLCPCHGSVFNADGTVAGGPSPRPLFTLETQVKNRRVLVKTEAIPLPLGM
jgi:menaquinol-cytochrome c reductase iron-sulfur subunit